MDGLQSTCHTKTSSTPRGTKPLVTRWPGVKSTHPYMPPPPLLRPTYQPSPFPRSSSPLPSVAPHLALLTSFPDLSLRTRTFGLSSEALKWLDLTDVSSVTTSCFFLGSGAHQGVVLVGWVVKGRQSYASERKDLPKAASNPEPAAASS